MLASDWSLCIKWKEWPMVRQQEQANSSNSSRGQGTWTSAPRFSSTSSSLVSSANSEQPPTYIKVITKWVHAKALLKIRHVLTGSSDYLLYDLSDFSLSILYSCVLCSRCIQSSPRVPRHWSPGQVSARGHWAGAHKEFSASVQRTLRGNWLTRAFISWLALNIYLRENMV